MSTTQWVSARYNGEKFYAYPGGPVIPYKSWTFIGKGIGDITMSDVNEFRFYRTGFVIFVCDLISTDTNDHFESIFELGGDDLQLPGVIGTSIGFGTVEQDLKEKGTWYHLTAPPAGPLSYPTDQPILPIYNKVTTLWGRWTG